MRDFYKKLMKMSVQDAQEIARENDIEAVDEMAMQLYQTRVNHWQMNAMEEHQLDFPDDPTRMYEYTVGRKTGEYRSDPLAGRLWFSIAVVHVLLTDSIVAFAAGDEETEGEVHESIPRR